MGSNKGKMVGGRYIIIIFKAIHVTIDDIRQ